LGNYITECVGLYVEGRNESKFVVTWLLGCG